VDTATNTTNTQPIPIIANIHTPMSSSSEIMHIVLVLNVLNTLQRVTDINMLLLTPEILEVAKVYTVVC
jgi:hypothetical protein